MCCILGRWKANAYKTVLQCLQFCYWRLYLFNIFSNVFKELKTFPIHKVAFLCIRSLIDVVYVNFQLIHRLHLKFIPGIWLKLGILIWEWTGDMTGVMLTHCGLSCIKDSSVLSSMFGRKVFLASVDRYFFSFLIL